jgi:hypothetical protein
VTALTRMTRSFPRSTVHPSTFRSGAARSLRDCASVELNLPGATRQLVVDGVRGWLYPLSSEHGDRFELFLYFDGSAYQVKVVLPAIESKGAAGEVDTHACHLFSDGRICFGQADAGGMPTLAEAYAKSVLWVNGYSVYLRTSRFPF